MPPSISGLLTQKLDSPVPTPGATARFSIVPTPKKANPNETWNKIKNERDGYGSEFRILKADRKEDYRHPTHGAFAQYSLLLEPVNTQEGAGVVAGKETAAPAASDRSDEINRAVAFKGAVEIAASRIQGGTLQPDDAADAIRALTASLLPVVRGERAEGKDIVTKTTEIPPMDTAESVQADQEIPF